MGDDIQYRKEMMGIVWTNLKLFYEYPLQQQWIFFIFFWKRNHYDKWRKNC
jgi:hypothetical protein